MSLTSKKLISFFVTNGCLLLVFFIILFFAKDYLNTILIPIISGIVANAGILTTGNIIDKKTISQNYVAELDK